MAQVGTHFEPTRTTRKDRHLYEIDATPRNKIATWRKNQAPHNCLRCPFSSEPSNDCNKSIRTYAFQAYTFYLIGILANKSQPHTYNMVYVLVQCT